MPPFPGSPHNAVLLNWHEPWKPEAPMATVNGDDISSTTPEGILRRLETWLNRNGPDLAADAPVIVEVKGHRTIVLTPLRRDYGPVVSRPTIIVNFDVKFWWRGKEYESLTQDLRTCVWPYS
jgi:hypothetical protein